ncbi:recombinase family protein [Maledivibacter halophilus]|uniref:Site-specific DNA recombinase n=1 Tax=Maledivibacter halophilus TaxID=36842 RepID=A0A1T5LPJ6_9FIRM|nr:recombinase family protein [Maledivibacter halophilus]SKC77468.1 Site-specific DNA recombinase [Maledivibacter halophilus]
MKEVHVIEARSDRINRRNSKKIERIRVAAYCRVSTDSEEQLLSYNSQVLHYRQLVQSNSEWELVEIYADEAISGTQINNRISFQKMINDALDDKIDLIITKSISRFARNTLDTLKYVRLLKKHNVAIFFEKENINTLTMNGEMLLVILSSLAQQESESISANVKMGLKMKMKRGEMTGFNGCLGYDYDPKQKILTVNEKEAEIIKYIFNRYISGMGCYVIAKELTKLKYKTKRGSTNWGESTVRGIIKNEKYKGDLLMGKTFTVDPITHRRLDNFGEEDKYYVKDHHEPIISKEVFEEAQRILAKRSPRKSMEKGLKREKYSRKYAFSSMMKCGFCGSTIGRRSWHGNNVTYRKIVWACITGTKKGKKYCNHFKSISEQALEAAFVDSFNLMCTNNKDVVVEFLKTVEESIGKSNLTKKLRKISEDIYKLENKLSKLVELNIDGIINKETYEAKYHDTTSEIEKLKDEQDQLGNAYEEQKELEKKMKSFRKVFDNNELLEKFDREIFENIIDKVVIGKVDESGIRNPYSVTFIFKTGLQLEEDCTVKKPNGIHGIKDETVYSYNGIDTCGDSCTTMSSQPLILLVFQQFCDFYSFSKNSENHPEKDLKRSIEIRIAI